MLSVTGDVLVLGGNNDAKDATVYHRMDLARFVGDAASRLFGRDKMTKNLFRDFRGLTIGALPEVHI